MPVSMVPVQAITQPQNPRKAQRIVQNPLNLPMAQRRVAIGVAQTLFGRHAQASAVPVDPAAFQHHRLRVDGKVKTARQPRTNVRITGHQIFAAPAIERKVGRAPRGAAAGDDRRGIAQPHIAQRLGDDVHVRGGQCARHGGVGIIVAHQLDPLAAPAIGYRARKSGYLRTGSVKRIAPFTANGGKTDP